MSVPLQRSIRISAPAKLNLGLEILGRRADGYHDLATIFLTVSLCDELTLTASNRLEIHCDDHQTPPAENNLAWRAARLLGARAIPMPGAAIELRKAIPIAAGLGGASSDGAATLIAARALWRLPTTDAELSRLAGQLGSDVPFFLHGGCALGQGRGEILQPLPLPSTIWFVLVAPKISIPRKTASLYAALQASDLSAGTTVGAQAARLHAGLSIDEHLLGNAFSRPLYERLPPLSELPEIMRRAGVAVPALSGAGPAHYAMIADPELAGHTATRLQSTLGNAARVAVVSPVPERSLLPGDYDVS